MSQAELPPTVYKKKKATAAGDLLIKTHNFETNSYCNGSGAPLGEPVPVL